MNSFISSSDINEEPQMNIDSESIRSNSSTNSAQTLINLPNNQSTKENDNHPIKKIHHNVSSFSELGDFLSESATNTVGINQSLDSPKEKVQPKKENQNKKKKKPAKRQPIKIDFSKIFSQDNNFDFLNDPKENNADITNINSNASRASFENELFETNNQETNNQETNIHFNQQAKDDYSKMDDILVNIESRIIDYFNHSVDMMISDFINDLRDILAGINAMDSLIQSFGMDLKKNIRQIINFKVPFPDILEVNSIELSLFPSKNLFADIKNLNPDKIKIYDSIKDCKESVSRQIEKINLEITPLINELRSELSKLHQLQQYITQKETKANTKRTSILQRLSDLEYSEIMQKMESDLFSLKRSRSHFPTFKPDNDLEKKEMLSQVYKFIKYYKRIQSNTSCKESIKRYSRLINDITDDFRNSCDIYNFKMRNNFKSIDYIQNQINMTLISNFQNTMISNLINESNNINSNNNQNISTNNENDKKNRIDLNQKDIKDNLKKKKSHHRSNEKHQSEIRYIEDLRRHDHRKFNHNSPK